MAAQPSASSDSVPPQEVSLVAPQCSIDGCRILNIAELSKAVHEMTAHSAICGGACVLEGETRSGLASMLSAACSKCHRMFYVHSF